MKLHNLYYTRSFIRAIKPRNLKWDRQVAWKKQKFLVLYLVCLNPTLMTQESNALPLDNPGPDEF